VTPVQREDEFWKDIQVPEGHPAVRASEADREWFEAHPDATVRLRPRVEGEFAEVDAEIPGDLAWVLVHLVGPELRIRQPVSIVAGDRARSYFAERPDREPLSLVNLDELLGEFRR
jgi:hypothetical protein